MITCIYHIAVISPGVSWGKESPYKCRTRIRLFESHWVEKKIAGCFAEESALTLPQAFCGWRVSGGCAEGAVGRPKIFEGLLCSFDLTKGHFVKWPQMTMARRSVRVALLLHGAWSPEELGLLTLGSRLPLGTASPWLSPVPCEAWGREAPQQG